MPDVTVSANVDTMMRAANNAAIRSAIGLGQTDAPTFNSLGVTNTATANVFSTSAAALQTAGYLGVARAINLIDTAGISWSSTSTLLGATGTNLLQDAAGILAQRNGTAKQVHRVYNTFLGTTANEWGGFDWLTTANTLRIGTEHGGTGTARPIDFVVGGVVVAGLTSTALTSTNSIVGKLGTTASPSFSFAGRTDSGMFSFSSTEITLVIGGVNALRLQTGICTVNSGNIGVGGGFDANLSRIAGSSLAIGNGTLGDFSGSLKLRNVIQSPGVATIVTPASNGDLVFETTSNTSVTVKLKGSDGTVRSVVLTLA